MMPSQFSKEDHIIRISKSVFVSNFPDSFRSRDLWNLCEPYGKVVDVFIPNRKSKDGKRFAFVRFIKVDDLEPLIVDPNVTIPLRCLIFGGVTSPPHNSKLSGSYAAAVNALKSSYGPPASPLSPPALVLDDTCINECDFSRHVMGKVKDLNSIPNLQTILAKEGFAEVKLSYLGRFWVLLELENANTKEKLLQHTGVNSWFLDLQVATNDFVCDERVVWVDIEGIPLNVWSHATFLKIGKKWGEVMDVEENLGPLFARKRLCIKTNLAGNILESFKVIFKGKVYMVRAKELFTWTPRFLEYKDSDYISDDEASIGANNNQVRPQQGDDHLGVKSDEEGVSETIFGDKPSSPCNNACNVNARVDDIHSVRRFTPEAQQYENILSVSSSLMVNKDASIPEKEYRPNVFSKLAILVVFYVLGRILFSRTDNFIALYETWLSINAKVLIVVVYAPQSPMLKRTIWDYISGLISRWKGETIVMGDFNDVRSEDESYGSTFIPSNARAFNHFISSSSLLEVKMEGYSFTWSHPSATKMSKLDRFLVSDGIFSAFPVITAICLNRHLSDHRPILLNEDQNIFNTGTKQAIIDDLVAIDKKLDSGLASDTLLLERLELTCAYWSFNRTGLLLSCYCFFVKWIFREFAMRLYCLVPNVSDAKCVRISGPKLDGSVYKVITKILANRLAAVISDLVSGTQSAFVANRQILDGPFILNEILSGVKGKRSKPYSALASILLNGSPTTDFPFIVVLNKGDPIAPVSFSFLLWSLSYFSFIRAVNEGFVKGLQLQESGVYFLILFYADDASSGLKINVQKSQVLGVGVSRDVVNQGATLIGCAVMQTPFKYLGVMVGDIMSRHRAWVNTIQKIQARLSKWKVKTLSIGGRLTLMKSVLGAVPLYNMSIYKVPKGSFS
ncbi:RNA-directed DNA polymerase, eukaryota [Tanacetum coccineum]